MFENIVKEDWHCGDKHIIAQFHGKKESEEFTKVRRNMRDKCDFCHICKELIKKEDRIATTISCHHGWLPNVIAHYDCLKGTGSIGLPELAKEYEKYKKMREAWG